MATQTMTQVIEPESEVNESRDNVMSVGGGSGDEAVDVTYSTKPNNPGIPLSQAKIITVNSQTNLGVNQGISEAGISHTGSIMGVGEGIGDNAVDVTYSTKPNTNMNIGSPTYNTITTEFSTQGREISQIGVTSTSGSVMGVGGGVGDDAVDVTYSTKPNNNNIVLGQELSLPQQQLLLPLKDMVWEWDLDKFQEKKLLFLLLEM
jgi:hypothetical protein